VIDILRCGDPATALEGIAIYALADGTGYIVCTDQLDGNSEDHVYPREGIPG